MILIRCFSLLLSPSVCLLSLPFLTQVPGRVKFSADANKPDIGSWLMYIQFASLAQQHNLTLCQVDDQVCGDDINAELKENLVNVGNLWSFYYSDVYWRNMYFCPHHVTCTRTHALCCPPFLCVFLQLLCSGFCCARTTGPDKRRPATAIVPHVFQPCLC